MQHSTELFKILSDETRLRIINLLHHQDLCVCELVEILNLPQPKISKHIAKIRSINLVNTVRNTQYIYYSLNHENTDFMKLLTPILNNLNYESLQNDLKQLNKVESFVCTKE